MLNYKCEIAIHKLCGEGYPTSMVLLSYFSLLTEISSGFFLVAWLVCFILFTHLNPI